MKEFLDGLMREFLVLVGVAGSACLLVRWAVPLALRMLLDLLEDGIALAAGCLLLPEYWVSSAARRRHAAPPRMAYEYGAAVAGGARHLQLALRRICRVLAVVARTTPLPLVAALAVVIRLSFLLA